MFGSLSPAIIGLLVMLLVVAAFGYDARLVAGEFGAAVFGRPDRAAAVLLVSCPLILLGLAVVLAFRCGVWNIGAEGQYLLGAALAAVAAAQVAAWPRGIAVGVVLLAGTIGGASWAGLAAALKRWRRVQEVLSTILLNFVAIQLVTILVRGPLVDPLSADRDSTANIPTSAELPYLIATAGLHAGIVVAVVLAPSLSIALMRTVWGFRTRVVGANPIAAEFAGIQTGLYSSGAFIVSGALAGLAGAIELAGNTHHLTAGFGCGYGYTAIAVGLLARLRPMAVIPAAVFFASLEVGTRGLQKSPDIALSEFPTVLTWVAQGTVILMTVLFTRTRLAGSGGVA